MMMEVRGSKWLWKNNNNKVRKKKKERERIIEEIKSERLR